MKKLRITVLMLSILLVSEVLFAQNATLTGKLSDEKSAAVGFASVSLLKATDSSLVASVTANKEGIFNIPSPEAGKYFLRITAIGFDVKRTDIFELVASNTAKDFGTIALRTDPKLMNDVTVTALRPTITQLADRLVVNIQGTAMAAGNTAFGVLSKSPGVFVDPEGNIQLNGRGGVTVMIDGRLTYLSARDLRNLLESTPAENIKSIEIITNPSAKYDAEGTSGIINIVFKKNVMQGINGNVYTGYSTNLKQHFYNAGATINHKSGRWNSFLITDFNRRGGGREATFTRIFHTPAGSTYFDQTAIGNFYAVGPPSLRLGSDFTLNSNHSIGFIGSFNTNTAHSEFLTETYLGSAPKRPSRFVDADNFNSNTYKGLITNIHYSGKLDSVGTTLSADVDYARIRNRGDGNFYNRFVNMGTGRDSVDRLYTYTPNGFNIYSGKIDFSYALNKDHKVEAGAKASRVTSDNDFRFYFNNNGLVVDPSRTNHFYYKEYIYAGYLNWSGTLSKKVSVQTGLRAEQTVSEGTSFTTGQVTPRKYLNLFPSLFIQQKLSDNYGINYSYSRRLTRPNYGNLNPFRSFRDPYTWTEGNPYLRPEYTNSFSITQTIRKIYILQLYYLHRIDPMVELPSVNAPGAITTYTTGNLDNAHNTGMSAIIPIKITKKWDTRNTVQLSYNKFKTVAANGNLIVNDQLFYSLQSAHTILLPKSFRMEANMNFRGPSVSGLYRQKAMYRIDIGFTKSFAKKKFEAVFNASDITKGWRFLWAANLGDNNVNEFDQYLRWRVFSFTLRYNFSKGQKVNIKQRSSVEELNRT